MNIRPIEIDNMPDLLTTREAMRFLRASRGVVYDMLHSGKLDGEKVGADWRIKKYSVEKYLKPKVSDEQENN